MLEDCSNQPAIASVLKDLGMANLKVLAVPQDIAAREKVPGGTVTFSQAVRMAIEAFCTDAVGTGTGYDTAYFAVKECPTDWGLPENPTREQIQSRLRQVLANNPDGKLVLLSEAVLQIEEYRFPPEQQESVTTNWVLRVIAPKEWGQLTWAIIDPTGKKPAYCYYHD